MHMYILMRVWTPRAGASAASRGRARAAAGPNGDYYYC